MREGEAPPGMWKVEQRRIRLPVVSKPGMFRTVSSYRVRCFTEAGWVYHGDEDGVFVWYRRERAAAVAQQLNEDEAAYTEHLAGCAKGRVVE